MARLTRSDGDLLGENLAQTVNYETAPFERAA